MPFQTRVNNELPAAFPGDFASANPRVTTIGVEGSWYADADGVAAASFVWVNELNRQAGNTATSTTAYTVSAATINAGGSGYAVGDTGNILAANGQVAAVYTVATVTSGAIATFTIASKLTSATNAAGTALASVVSSGGGSGATFNVTTTSTTVGTVPDGFVRRAGLSAITTYPQESTMTMLPGTPLTIYDNGEFWIALPSGVTATRLTAVYCDPTTGGIVASTASGAVATNYVYAESGDPGDMVKISSWLKAVS